MRKFLLSFLAVIPLVAQTPVRISPLPRFSTFLKANSTIQGVASDAAGNIYVYGETNFDTVNAYPHSVFVAELDSTGTNLIYEREFGGSAITRAGAFTVDSAGNSYIAGYTSSPNFPSLPSSAISPATDSQTLFVAKIDPVGRLLYSTFVSGSTGSPEAIAVDSSGNAIVSGQGQLTATPKAYNNAWIPFGLPFIFKLNSSGATQFISVGVGGSRLALDNLGNILVAGSTGSYPGQALYPTTPGAYQTTYNPFVICPPTPCMLPIPVSEQYVSKLSADGTTLLWSTFVSGSLGATNAGMALDKSGNVWLTGDTASPDYPYTTAPASPTDLFTTELDPTGSKLLLSAPVGVPPGPANNLSFDPVGNIIEVGPFPSKPGATIPPNASPNPMPPDTSSTRPECLAGQGTYALRVSSQDATILGTQILPSNTNVSSSVDTQGNIYIAGATSLPTIPLSPGIYYDSAATQRTISGSYLERTNFELPASPLSCATDSTSMTPLGPIAPGQLITLYGAGLGPTQPAFGLLSGSSAVPTSLSGITVTFNGHPAPLLYTSPNQINVQVPFELTGSDGAQMQLNYQGQGVANRTFALTPLNPTVFLTSSQSTCGIAFYGSPALALNQDGTVNSCVNPARAGSTFTVFVNGMGNTTPSNYTGTIIANPRPVNSVTALLNGNYSLEVESFMDQKGAISGIGQLTARVPSNVAVAQALSLRLTLGGVPAGPLLGGFLGLNQPSEIPVIVFAAP